jgi:hypothetical protein
VPDQDATPEWLQETEGKTVFQGDVLRINHDGEISYDVQRGGWNFDPGPDTWFARQLLARFDGHRVRITVDDLGWSPLLRDPGRQQARSDRG